MWLFGFLLVNMILQNEGFNGSSSFKNISNASKIVIACIDKGYLKSVESIYEGTLVSIDCQRVPSEQNSELNFPGMGIKTFPDNWNRLLPEDYKIKIFDFGHNEIDTLSKEFLNGLPSGITRLYLNHNKISNLEPAAFSGLPSLKMLVLNFNNLRKIRRDSFKGLTSLLSLYLNNNTICSLEVGAFSGLPSLMILELKSNNLRKIRQDSFKGLTSLLSLNLDNNTISSLEVGAFSGLVSIYKISLGSNELPEIIDDVFPELPPSLEDLNLEMNRISRIKSGSLSSSSLLKLSLQGNLLEAIEENMLAGLTGLQYLDLSNNSIRTVGPGAFEDLCDLVELDLRGNQIDKFNMGSQSRCLKKFGYTVKLGAECLHEVV